MSDAGVLFDVDGTLVDTTYLHTVCWAEAFRGVGRVVTMSEIHHGIGMGSTELFDHLFGEDRDTTDDDELTAAHLVLYRQYWARLRPLPGAVELLRECAKRSLRVVLASSASDAELAALRSALDADDVVSVSTSSSDAEAGKPRPDVLEAALNASGLTAKDSLFVGDSVWDGAAAARADIRFLAVTCGGTPETQLRRAGALEVWRDPADLLANIEHSLLDTLGTPGHC